MTINLPNFAPTPTTQADPALNAWLAALSNYLQKNVASEQIAISTASNSASLTQLSLNSKYNCYLVVLSNILLATDNTALWLRFSTDNSTFITSNYRYAYATALENATGSNHGSGSASSIVLDDSLGSTSNRGYSGHIMIYNPSASTTTPYVTYHNSRRDNAGLFRSTFGGGSYDAGIAIQGIQVLGATGNIASGTMKVYGFLT